MALLAAALLSAGASACGGASKDTSSTSRSSSAATVTPGGYLRNDGDKDPDDKDPTDKDPGLDDSALLAIYGGETSRAEMRAVTSVVKLYFAAATAEDGTQACPLLAAGLAAELSTSQSTQSVDKACAAPLSLLFKQQHQSLLADDAATMVVTAVHVKGDLGLAVLGFQSVPEAEILLQREGHVWKIDALFDSEMP